MKLTLTKPKVTLESIAKSIEALATKQDIDDAVDTLAGAVKLGFDEVHAKFKAIDERFVKIDERFEKIDERFNVLERKVDRMNDSFTNQIDHIVLHYAPRHELVAFDGRLKKVEKKIGI